MPSKKTIKSDVHDTSKPPGRLTAPKTPSSPSAPSARSKTTIRAANDNGRLHRVVVLRNFETLPVSLDEVAVVDRLMQDLHSCANDNSPIWAAPEGH